MTTSHNKHPLQFDLFSPLKTCTTLIEASAGTGKTYTISRLVLRLLVEYKISIDRILVVTFTEAATMELRHRIRNLLAVALDAFTNNNSCDEFFVALQQRVDRDTALRCIGAALHRFDDVAVYTIHGFCERILRENAFESGQRFDTELITDQDDIIREIAEDFWRSHFYTAQKSFMSYVLAKKQSPDSFIALWQRQKGMIRPQIIPALKTVDTELQENEFAQFVETIKTEWKTSREEIRNLLTSQGMNKRIYSAKAIDYLIDTCDTFCMSQSYNPLIVLELDKMTCSVIIKNTKKDFAPVSHHFFDLMNQLFTKATCLCKDYDKTLLGIQSTFITHCAQELTKKKSAGNVQYFDDLIMRVKASVDKQDSVSFTRSVQSKFSAVLIDEFQDTDPVQYAIFHSLFSKNCIQFFIGDPKQAIFSFRGADIFAYIAAAQTVDHVYTLTTNFRSAPDIIASVNTLFSQNPQPFLLHDIHYHPVQPRPDKRPCLLTINNASEPAFRIWLVNQDTSPAFKTKTSSQRKIAHAVSEEIVRLLSLAEKGNVVFEKGAIKEPLKHSHIAILVRTHTEAALMQEDLFAHGVQSVIDSDASVFASNSARALTYVLRACANPDSLCALKTALSTPLFGLGACDIQALDTTESELNRRINRMHEYQTLWHDHGIMAMLEKMFSNENVRERFLGQFGGERAITDILHLCELLHVQEHATGMHAQSLLTWFDKKITGSVDKSSSDEERIRLESDANAVHIVTIHKSKGLEYPVVFCPFSWSASQTPATAKNKPVLFHDPAQNYASILALGEKEITAAHPFAEQETLAENIRLLYVALTRAQARCYLVCGRLPGAESSALAYLLHGTGITENVATNLAAFVNSLSFETIENKIATLATNESNGLAYSILQTESTTTVFSATQLEQPVLSFRQFTYDIPKDWRITSFTGLSHHRIVDKYDKEFFEQRLQPETVLEETIPVLASASFPAGADAGVFFHSLFETINFTAFDPKTAQSSVEDALKNADFDTSLAPLTIDIIDNVINTVIDTVDSKPVTLRSIEPSACLREAGFYFPLKKITPIDIRDIFSGFDGSEEYGKTLTNESPNKLVFSPVCGYLKGFIDMIFMQHERYFLVDWKSNLLGQSLDNYNNASLAAAMRQEHYILQYHLYLAAMHTYLSQRIADYNYDTHFGSVLYVFLRGVDKSKGSQYGIFRDRPSKECVTALCNRLIDKSV